MIKRFSIEDRAFLVSSVEAREFKGLTAEDRVKLCKEYRRVFPTSDRSDTSIWAGYYTIRRELERTTPGMNARYSDSTTKSPNLSY